MPKFSAQKPRVSRSFGLLATAFSVAALFSCQTGVRPDESVLTGAKSVSYTPPDTSIHVDQASAKIVGETGTIAVGVTAGTRGASNLALTLAKPLGTGTLKISLSTYGMVTTTITCHQNDDGTLALDSNGTQYDSLARTLVRRLDGVKYTKDAAGAIAAYADALLANEPLFTPFPKSLPAGVDSNAVRAAALRNVVKASKPLAEQTAAWALGLTEGQAKAMILALSPAISKADSIALFPDSSLRVTRKRDSIPPRLVAKDGSRALPFGTTSAKVSWTVTDNYRLDSVWIQGQFVAVGTDGFYSSTVTLKDSVTRVVIAATDSFGNRGVDTAVITRGGDAIPPTVKLIAGLQQTTKLDFSVSDLAVGWTVSDNGPLKSVTINKVVTSENGGVYGTTLKDVVFGTTRVILAATDSSDNQTIDTLTVVRDLGASPVLTVSHPEDTCDSVLHVVIHSTVPEAEIKYTLDGTAPSDVNGFSYTPGAAILINQNRTLKAIATAPNRTPSALLTKTYVLVVDPVKFSLPTNTTTDSTFVVTVTSATVGVTFYYTLDGSTPIAGTSKSTTSQITIDSIRTVKVMAVKSGWTSSAVATSSYRANVPIHISYGLGGARVVRADGSLWTTGPAISLADGSTLARTEFAKAMEGVLAADRDLILMRNGDVLAYGGNYGSTVTKSVKVATGMKKISAGAEPSAMMIDTRDVLWGLGGNQEGQLCTGYAVDAPVPVIIASNVKKVAVGCSSARGAYFCASVFVTNAGYAYGCGNVGFGVTRLDNLKQTQIPGTGYTDVASFFDAYQGSWAYNTFLIRSGELYEAGFAALVLSHSAVIEKVVPVGGATFALAQYGLLYGNGVNGGLFGNGSLADVSTWTLITNYVTDVASDGYSTMVIKSNGTLWATGSNGGVFGNGTTAAANSFVQIHLPN